MPAIGPLELVELDGVDATGLSVERVRDGRRRVRAKRLALGSAVLRLGPVSASITNAALVNVLACTSRATAGDALELVDVTADEVRIGQVQVVLHGLPEAPRPAALRMQALDDADGLLRVFMTDVLWFVDAEIVVPLAKGVVDLRRVDVNHIGPDSTVRMAPTGLQVRTPHGQAIDVLAFDVREPGFRDGLLDVRSIVESLVRSPPGRRAVHLADPRLAKPLRETRVEGDVQLGDGALGTAADHVVLAHRVEGRNRVEISSPALGERVVVRVPAFAASSGTFVLPGRTLSTSTIGAAVEVQVVSFPADGPDRDRSIAVSASDVRISGVKVAAATPSDDDGSTGSRVGQSGKAATSG